jgi:hypothetical protein
VLEQVRVDGRDRMRVRTGKGAVLAVTAVNANEGRNEGAARANGVATTTAAAETTTAEAAATATAVAQQRQQRRQQLM